MREPSRFPPYRSSQYGGFETKGKRGDRCRPQQISVPQSLVFETPYKPVEPPHSLLSRERERGGERETERDEGGRVRRLSIAGRPDGTASRPRFFRLPWSWGCSECSAWCLQEELSVDRHV